MMADNAKLLFAISFLLLSIFATFCPIPSLFSHVKAAERQEALCGEGEYFESGSGRCISCDIPCKSSIESCREHGCLDYIKRKKEQCKPDEYYEMTLGKCRPCSIPCSMSVEACQNMGCTDTDVTNLPLATTGSDQSDSQSRLEPTPVVADSPPATTGPGHGDSQITYGQIIAIVPLPLLIGALLMYCANTGRKRVLDSLVDKHKKILTGSKEPTPCQKRELRILKIFCRRTYKRITSGVGFIELKTRKSNEKRGGPHGAEEQKPIITRENACNEQPVDNLDVVVHNGGRDQVVDDVDGKHSGAEEQEPLITPTNAQPVDNTEVLKHNDGRDQAVDDVDGKNSDPMKTSTTKSFHVNEKQSELHNTLATNLDKNLTEKQFKTLRNFLRGSHGISNMRDIDAANSVEELMVLLRKDKKIEIGAPKGYRLLIVGLKLINEQVLADMVVDYQSQIANAGNDQVRE